MTYQDSAGCRQANWRAAHLEMKSRGSKCGRDAAVRWATGPIGCLS